MEGVEKIIPDVLKYVVVLLKVRHFTNQRLCNLRCFTSVRLKVIVEVYELASLGVFF